MDRDRIRVCREFREFDALSDEECLRVLSYLLQRQGLDGRSDFLSGIGMLVVFGGVSVLAFGMLSMSVVAALPTARDETIDFIRLTGSIAPAVFAAALVRGQIVRGSLRAFVDETARSLDDASRCPACKYSFDGLPLEGASLRCPECGEALSLETASELQATIAAVAGARVRRAVPAP